MKLAHERLLSDFISQPVGNSAQRSSLLRSVVQTVLVGEPGQLPPLLPEFWTQADGRAGGSPQQRPWLFEESEGEREVISQMSALQLRGRGNDSIARACDAVALSHSPTLGRHVVATRAIARGEVLIAEPPYEHVWYADIPDAAVGSWQEQLPTEMLLALKVWHRGARDIAQAGEAGSADSGCYLGNYRSVQHLQKQWRALSTTEVRDMVVLAAMVGALTASDPSDAAAAAASATVLRAVTCAEETLAHACQLRTNAVAITAVGGVDGSDGSAVSAIYQKRLGLGW